MGLDDDADAAPVRLVNINEEDLVKLFHLPLSNACREAGLCSTTFKKACRYHGLRKWPFRRTHRKGERKGGERGVGVDVTNTTATVSQSVDMFRRSNAGEGGVAGKEKGMGRDVAAFAIPATPPSPAFDLRNMSTLCDTVAVVFVASTPTPRSPPSRSPFRGGRRYGHLRSP